MMTPRTRGIEAEAVIVMMLMWIVPAILIVWIVAATAGRPSDLEGYGPAQPVGYDPAVEIVRERYARGEIGRDEYERLVAGLLGGA